MILASGGGDVELIADSVPLLLPLVRAEVEAGLGDHIPSDDLLLD